MNKRDAELVIDMRVSIKLSHAAVSGPARVAEADRARDAAHIFKFVFEIGDAADGLDDLKLAAAVDGGNTGGVIAAILEAFEAFNEDFLGLFTSDVGDNSTHKRGSP